MALEELIAAREALIDASEASLKSALASVAEKIQQAAPTSIAQWRDAQFVFDVLMGSGVGEIVDALPYMERATMAARMAAEAGVNVDRVSAAPVQALRTSNQALVEAYSRSAAERIRAAMFAATLTPTSINPTQLAQSLRTSVNLSLAQLETQVNTAMSAWDRQVLDEIGAGADLDLFVYTGPLDKLNRPFCRSMMSANRAYTGSEIEDLNNHPSLPSYVPPNVRAYCGGYNCRHTFIPVSESFARANGYQFGPER